MGMGLSVDNYSNNRNDSIPYTPQPSPKPQ